VVVLLLVVNGVGADADADEARKIGLTGSGHLNI
jgi:hypothetical protein